MKWIIHVQWRSGKSLLLVPFHFMTKIYEVGLITSVTHGNPLSSTVGFCGQTIPSITFTLLGTHLLKPPSRSSSLFRDISTVKSPCPRCAWYDSARLIWIVMAISYSLAILHYPMIQSSTTTPHCHIDLSATTHQLPYQTRFHFPSP